MKTLKAKVVKDKANGLWDVIKPDGTSKWFYTKEDALHYRNKFNKGDRDPLHIIERNGKIVAGNK